MGLLWQGERSGGGSTWGAITATLAWLIRLRTLLLETLSGKVGLGTGEGVRVAPMASCDRITVLWWALLHSPAHLGGTGFVGGSYRLSFLDNRGL